jgi:hypothetical protein
VYNLRYLLAKVRTTREKGAEEENHNVGLRHHDFPVPDAFPHVIRTLASRQRRLYSLCLCFSLL